MSTPKEACVICVHKLFSVSLLGSVIRGEDVEE